MTTIPLQEEEIKDNVQVCETIEPLDIPPQTEEVKDPHGAGGYDGSNEAKNIYDLCPPSIKREIMTRLTKKKILLYDPDMQTPEALEVVVRVKEAYDRKKQRSCNDLKNKRLAKQTTSEQPAEEIQAEEASEEEGEISIQSNEPAEVLQPAKILEPVKQVRKQAKKVVKKEVQTPIEKSVNQEPQTPRSPPPVKVGLFKSEVATIPKVSTKLFM